MRVDIEDINELQDKRVKINQCKLFNIEFYENGKKLDIPFSKLASFQYSGLNNMDFITSGIYKEQ